jgi:nucleoside-diphosphate-sugar epimerase
VIKIIITGLNGFLGSYFKKYIESIENDVEIFNSRFDITKDYLVKNIIKNYQPDYFFNFAAISNPKSGASVQEFLKINVHPVLTQLENIGEFCPKCKYVNAGSYLELFESNEYTLSKKLSRSCVDFYSKKGLKVAQYYLGNFTSKEQSTEYFLPRVINFVKKYKNGDILNLGDLTSCRSYLHVEDVCKIIWENSIKNNLHAYTLYSPDFYNLKTIVQRVFSTFDIRTIWRADNLFIDKTSTIVLNSKTKKNTKNYTNFSIMAENSEIEKKELKYNSIDKIIKSFII